MSKNIPKTEFLYSKCDPIDRLSTIDAVHLIIQEQGKAATEAKKSSKSIETAIEAIYKYLLLNPKGRLIYAGAGTSGRIGMQDGVELFPTFNWPKNRLDFIIAGGNEAIFKAVENAEDNTTDAEKIVQKLFINSQDIVIGLAASGNTPFTCKVMEEAYRIGALTIAISNNPLGKILNYGKVKIVLNTKEEVIAGSTRLKAATAQKICLNTISSIVMTKLGRVKNGYMNNMVVTNSKLRKRRILINNKLND